MRKLSLFMLMAVGLLISGNAGATTLTVGTVESGAMYQDLSSAITAAMADDEIQLLSDVDFNATITIGKKLTFNLNGKTLKLTTASKYLSLTAATTYTFKDGTIVDGGVKAGSGLIYINKASAKLILENVEISSPTAGGYAIYANTSSTIQFEGTTSLQGATGILYVKAGATIVNNAQLEGTVIVAKGKTLTYSGTGSLVLTGGYLPKGWELPTGVSIADGKIGVNTWNSTYGECLQIAAGTDVVAKIGNYEYAAVSTAITAATTANLGGQEVVLQKDADLTAAATMVAGSTLDLNGFTLRPTTTAAIITCNTQNGEYTIKNGKIDAGEIKPAQLISIASKTGINLNLEDVDLVNKGKYNVYSSVTSSTLNFDAATTFSAATAEVYAYVKSSVTSPLTITPPTGQENDYVMTNVAAGYWRMVKIADAKFTVTDGENTTYHSVWSEALYDAKLAAGKTLKMFDDVTLTAATTLHNGILDLNTHTMSVATTACSLTCSTTNGGYTIKNGKIDAGAIKIDKLISLATGTGMTLTLEDVDLVNNTGKYDIYVTTTDNILTFDKNTTFSAATAKACWYVKGNTATDSPLTLNSPITGDVADYAMAHVAAGTWYMIARDGAKFEVDGIPHLTWSQALYDASLATGKTLKMLDDVTLTAATTLHNGILDLNEHAISINGNVGITCCPADNANVTIKNGTISTTATKTAAALLVNTKTGAQVSLQNVKVSAPSYYPIQLNTASKSNTLTIDADCELTGKTYAIYVYEACTPTINNYATLTQNIYATADPSLTINNYGTIPGLSFYKANAKNHTINNYAGGAIVFNPNQTLSGQVTLNNEGALDIQKIVSNMVITGNGTFKLISGSYVNIDLPAATYVDLAEGTIIRAEDLQDVGPAPEGLKWLNPTMHGGIPACKLVKADAETVCKIGDYEYISLADAVAAVPTDGTEKQITMVKDVDYGELGAEITSVVSVEGNQKVILELNGHVISCISTAPKNFALITNYGYLTIQDNTDILFNGTGKGKLTTLATDPDKKASPGYASNTIWNKNHLTVLSGYIEATSQGMASYAIDNDNRDGHVVPAEKTISLEVYGGKIKANESNSIRMYLLSSYDNVVKVQGDLSSTPKKNPEVYRLWVQEDGATNKGSLTIKNATLPEGLRIGYGGVSEHFALDIDNTVFGEYFSYLLDPTKEGNTFSIKNSAIGSFYMPNPKPIFTEEDNNIYNFADDINVDWVGDGKTEHLENLIKEWESVEGQYIVDGGEYPGQWVHGYWKADKLLHGFYDCVKSGGLISVVYEGFDNPYKLGKLQGTTGEDSGIYDGELGNPWHQDKTWDLTEADVVPQDTTPVHIDHDVYVETDTKADAASIIVEPEQTLTIQEGATLIVGNAGIVFNNEEGKTPGKIVVEPGATLLDGANGIISEDTKNIVIQASETAQGTFLFDPEVSLNTHPFGTVELISRSGLRKYPNGNLVNYWHRFASPVMELTEGNFTNDWDTYSATTGLQIAAGTYFQTQIFQWSTYLRDWQRIDNKENYCDSIVPFQGYTMLNNCTWDDTHKGGVTYTFRGNLVGNHNDDLSFLCKGYNYFGNSYTAPINIKELLKAVDNDDINRTVYIWDAELQVFRGWSFEQLLYVDDETTPASIPSMQTFVMQLLNGNSAVSQIDYVNAIWNPVVNAIKTNKAPQKAQQVLDATLKINIVAANGEKDAVVMMKDGRYSNELDNGADAEKYMNDGSVNLYAHAEFANVSTIADAEIEGTKLSLVSNNETEYIMTFSAVSGEQYAIRDNFTGSVITITEGNTYAFSTNANSVEENRFEIVAVYSAPTDVKNISTNAAPKGIYSVTGQYVGEAQDWFNLPAGVYVMDGQKVVK